VLSKNVRAVLLSGKDFGSVAFGLGRVSGYSAGKAQCELEVFNDMKQLVSHQA
jgi:hypothetical protein